VKNFMKNSIILGITMGDPNGIGPEIIIKYLMSEKKVDAMFVVFGAEEVFDYYLKMFELNIPINVINGDIESEYNEDAINIINTTKVDMSQIKAGQLSKEGGRSAFLSADMAIDYVFKGSIDAVITAPFNKEAINMAGFKYAGHTELLAEKAGTKDFVMMLAARDFRVALVTTHVALRSVPKLITKERVLKTIRIANDALCNQFGIKNPKIAVCALNPHASEHSLMGDEEEKFIIPAVNSARGLGINVSGPYPADTIFSENNRQYYDCFISMYHDQGLGVLKALYFDEGVNITLGIPIIRTSPDHGTAFDIAGKFIASYKSIKEAINQAYKMAELLHHSTPSFRA